MTQTYTYNPEDWLLSLTRAIKEYVDDNLSDAVYEVVMEFPPTNMVQRFVPLGKTLVHFEIDAIEDRLVGFGEVIGNYNYSGLVGNQHANPQEARMHNVNFDVGVWASDASGGTTSRMKVRQYLTNLFKGAQAQSKLNSAVDAGDGTIEILNFSGGRFLTDTINDVDVYRTVDGILEVRVFSRTPLIADIPTVEDIVEDENLDIGGVAIP